MHERTGSEDFDRRRIDHSFLFEEGVWRAAGQYWMGGTNRCPLHGRSVVTHRDATWRIEGEMELLGDTPLRISSVYLVDPPRTGTRVLSWRSDNPATGRLAGSFHVTGRTILAVFRSQDDALRGTEALTRVGRERYIASGALLAGGDTMGHWEVEMHRVPTAGAAGWRG